MDSPPLAAGTGAEHDDHRALHQPDGADDRPEGVRHALQERTEGAGAARLAERRERPDRHAALLRRPVSSRHHQSGPAGFLSLPAGGGTDRDADIRRQGVQPDAASPRADRFRLGCSQAGAALRRRHVTHLGALDTPDAAGQGAALQRAAAQGVGYFSLVALVSTGIMTLTNPLVQTLLPRMTMLVSEGRIGDMQALYLN